MSIINLKNINFNNESIRISPNRIFAYKNSSFTDNGSFFKKINEYNLNQIEKVNIDTNKSEFFYGLLSHNAIQQSNTQSAIREINNNTNNFINNGNFNETSGIFKIMSGNICGCEQNDTNCSQKLDLSKPTLGSILDENQKNIEIESRYFGIKRLQQEFKPFSPTLQKKKIIKEKLLKNISAISDSKLQQELNYGFYNYNCLNFFNIQPSKEILNSEELTSTDIKLIQENTHSCGLVYSNRKINNKNIFPNSKGEMTLNFWINPKRSNSTGYYYNPGCIINIPNVMSIYLIEKEETRNELQQAQEFYLLFQLESNSNTNQPRNIVLNKTFITNNALKFNNWHNISINLYINKLKVYIDNVYDIFELNNNLNFTNNFDSIITIGNKLNYQNSSYQYNWNNTSNIRKFFFNQSTFKKQSLSQEDIYILQNSDIVEDLNTLNFLNTKLYENDIDLSTISDESFALNAELQGLIIFNENINRDKINDIATGKDYSLLNSEQLAFYLPCMYLAINTERDAYITFGDTSRILTQSFINPYFSERVNGLEVNVENFLIDFAFKRKPFILGMSPIKYKDSFMKMNNTSNLYLKEKKKNIIIDFWKYHKNPNQIYNKTFSSDIPFIDTDYFNISNFLKNNLIYRNNFILPCDNGLNKINLQNYANTKFSSEIYSEFYHFENLNFVNANSLFNKSKYILKDDKFFEIPFIVNSLTNVTNESNNSSINSGILYKNSNYRDADLTKFLLDNTSNTSLQKNCYSIDFDKNMIRNNSNIKLYEIMFNKIKNVKNEYRNNWSVPRLTMNSIFKNFDDEIKVVGNISEKTLNRTIKQYNNINSFTDVSSIQSYVDDFICSNYSIEGEVFETYSVLFDISNKLYSSRIRNNNLTLKDYDIAGTGGACEISLKDNGNGLIYRADCLTPHATWNYVGNIFYRDGLLNVLHPGLSSFGENNFICELKGDHKLFVYEVNIPVEKGDLNVSLNKTYQKLRPTDGLYDVDEEDFVYITNVNLHDENLNIVAKANFAQPIVKRQNDRYNFRLKMDF